MEIRIDRVTRQRIAACGVTLPSGPTRLDPMLNQLGIVGREPDTGGPYTSSPILRGCRLLVGDPHIAYRIDEDQIVLLAMQRGVREHATRTAGDVRYVELSGRPTLAVMAARSALVTEPIDLTRPPVLTRAEAHEYRAAVYEHVLSMDKTGATGPFVFTWRGLGALGLWIPDVMLGVAVGVAREGEMDALEERGRSELEFVRSVLERFGES
jgi:hypothetical protein